MTAAVLHPEQLVDPLVELVVAHAVEVEAHEVEAFDRRLVLERSRDEGRGADQVARRHEQRVRVRGLELADVRRQVLDAASGDADGQRGPDAARRRRLVRRSQVPVEVVEAENLELGRLGVLCALAGRIALCHCSDRQHEQDDGEQEQYR